MQLPTCRSLRVRNTTDAHVIFHAVSINLLPMVTRRLDTDERRSITSGCVFVWEERGSNAEASGVCSSYGASPMNGRLTAVQLGIERWTDSIRWGPSRVRDEFLFYHEKEGGPAEKDSPSSSNESPSNNLVKQTYSVFVETPRGRRKWHLIAYFTQDTLDRLPTIDDYPELANIQVPPGKYKSARSAKNSGRSQNYFELHGAYDPHSPNPYASDYPASSGFSYPPDHCQIVDGRRRESGLAPLAYLQNIPPPRRHPVDEEALLSLRPTVWAAQY